MTHIVKLKIENILGAKSVTFAPNGESVTIGGKNEQGKSSAIRALCMALGGKGYMPENPVTLGEESGRVLIELDHYLVKLDVDSERASRLKIQAKDGGKISNAQTMLNELFGDLSFDPGVFISSLPKKRLDLLVRVTGIDFEEFGRKEAQAMEDRKSAKQELKRLEVSLANQPETDVLPTTPLISVAEISNTLMEINNLKYEIDNVVGRRKTLVQALGQKHEEAERLRAELERLRSECFDIGEQIKSEEGDEYSLRTMLSNYENVDTLTERLETAESTNEKIRQAQQIDKLKDSVTAARSDCEEKEAAVLKVREDRKKAISESSLPVDGLSVSEDGDILFGDVPFEQLAESRKWDISTAIGFALNPKGIVFLSNSGGLDIDSRERIRQRATEQGVQLFLEVVDDAPDVQIVIEEGKVKVDRLGEK